MTKKKVELAFITNETARKACFKKRKMGLMKKTAELSTLCGIQACAIIYSTFEPEPSVWPSIEEARLVATKFKELPEMEQSNKMLNQNSYLRQQISKFGEQLQKERKENRESAITQLMFARIAGNNQYNLSMVDLHDLDWVIDQHMKDVRDKMDSLQRMSEINHKYPNIHIGTSNVGGRLQFVRSPIDLAVHEANNQPGNWSMDPMTSQEGGHAHGGLAVDGNFGDEMMLSFMDTDNIDFNGSYWNGAF